MYLFDDNKLTASMWPKSISCPRRNMNNNLHTYFFFWYPSNCLSPKMKGNNQVLQFTVQQLKAVSTTLTLSHPEALLWQVKSSGVRQSKITKCPLLAALGGKGLKYSTCTCIVLPPGYIILGFYQSRESLWMGKGVTGPIFLTYRIFRAITRTAV